MGSHPSVESKKPGVKVTSESPFTQKVFARRQEEKIGTKDNKGESSYVESTNITKEVDARIQLDNIIEALREATAKMHTLPNLRDENGNWIKDVGDGLRTVLNKLHGIESSGQLTYSIIESYKREAARLICSSKTMTILCSVVKEGWIMYYEDREMKLTVDQFQVIMLALLTLSLLSNASDEAKCDIAKETDLLQTLTTILKNCFDPNILNKEKKTDTDQLVRNSLLILCNISQAVENRQILRNMNNVKIVALYLDTMYRFVALSYLANIINEDESDDLQGKDHAVETIKFLSDLLSGTLNNKEHKCSDDCELEWSAKECAQLIRVLARNELSKELLVEKGCLPHLVKLARYGTVEEQKEAVGAIWALAFNKANQKKMLEDDTLNIVSMLRDLMDLTRSLDNVRKAADGILWILRDQLKQNEEFKDLDVLKKRNVPDSEAGIRKGHIMISYNRQHREKAKWIRDQLEANGYKVWMDIGNMGGSTSQTMAEAVESAQVFLFCYSQGYKDSNPCREEADYAKSLGVQMIPILMEEGYKADGWLGLYVSINYFYDFSGKYPREEKFQELLAYIHKCYPKLQGTTALTINSGSRSRTSLSELRKWTSIEMDKWIEQHKLPKKEFEQTTGRDLAALITMKRNAPECFYSYIKTDLKITSLSTIDLFIEALEDVSQ